MFCLAGAERLRSCVWAFEKEYAVSMQPFFGWCASLMDALLAGTVQQLPLDALMEEVENLTPNSDEYGQPLAVQAQSALLCVLNALAVLRDGRVGSVVDASYAVVDALENFVYLIHVGLLNDAAVPADREIVQRERGWQLTTIAFLRNLETCSREQLLAWRAQHREYSVPVAIAV